jgi:hypothetical protein
MAIFQPGGGCGCCGGGSTCNVTFTIGGCGGFVLQNATVSIWTDNTKVTLLATGTTDASGKVTLNIGTAGTYYKEISASRFVTLSSTQAFTCSSNLSFTLSTIVSGYHCANCAYPIKDTLTYTDSILGSTTLTYTSGLWKGTLVYSFPGATVCLCACPAKTVTISISLNPCAQVQYTWSASATCASSCPDDGGGGGTIGPVSLIGVSTASVCYVPSVSAFSCTETGNSGAACSGGSPSAQAMLYGSGTLSVTKTTTE